MAGAASEMTYLNLSENRLGDAGGLALGAALEAGGFPSLAILDLSGGGAAGMLSAKAMLALAEGLGRGPHAETRALHSLYLNDARLKQDERAQVVTSAGMAGISVSF